MTRFKIYGIIFLIGLSSSCQLTEASSSKSDQLADYGREDFDDFYKEFHKDSLFQISRIQFQLPGINSDAMTVDDKTWFWNKNEWLMHHTIDTTLFTRKLLSSNHMVEEVITSNEPGVFIKRRFKNIKGKWYLVMYEDVNL